MSPPAAVHGPTAAQTATTLRHVFLGKNALISHAVELLQLLVKRVPARHGNLLESTLGTFHSQHDDFNAQQHDGTAAHHNVNDHTGAGKKRRTAGYEDNLERERKRERERERERGRGGRYFQRGYYHCTRDN